MQKLSKKFITALAGAVIFSFTLTGCGNNQSAKTNKSQIAVTYTLKQNKKTFAQKKVNVKKNAKVMTGLKKAWKVQENKGFITSIDGKSQNPKKKIYWTYTINNKFANKGASQETLHKNDKIKFTLAKVKG